MATALPDAAFTWVVGVATEELLLTAVIAGTLVVAPETGAAVVPLESAEVEVAVVGAVPLATAVAPVALAKPKEMPPAATTATIVDATVVRETRVNNSSRRLAVQGSVMRSSGACSGGFVHPDPGGP